MPDREAAVAETLCERPSADGTDFVATTWGWFCYGARLSTGEMRSLEGVCSGIFFVDYDPYPFGVGCSH